MTISVLNCFSVTIYMRDNNQYSGKIIKIDNQKIYVSSDSDKIYIINKSDIKAIYNKQLLTDNHEDITLEIMILKPFGSINYNTSNEIINIKLDENNIVDSTYVYYDWLQNDNTKSYNSRRGFILGFGVGGNYTSFKQKVTVDDESFETGTVNKQGFATDFRIGYAPKYNLEIYYVSKISWFKMKNYFNDHVIVGNGISAIGFSSFTSPDLTESNWVPSPYISLGCGLSYWSTPFKTTDKHSIGFGYYAAIGYEFSKHLRAEFNYYKTNPSHKENGLELQTNSNVLMILLNCMGY